MSRPNPARSYADARSATGSLARNQTVQVDCWPMVAGEREGRARDLDLYGYGRSSRPSPSLGTGEKGGYAGKLCQGGTAIRGRSEYTGGRGANAVKPRHR